MKAFNSRVITPPILAAMSAGVVLSTILNEIGIDRLSQITDITGQQKVLDLLARKIDDVYRPNIPTSTLPHLKLYVNQKEKYPAYTLRTDIYASKAQHRIGVLDEINAPSILVHYNLQPRLTYRHVYTSTGVSLIMESSPRVRVDDIKEWVYTCISKKKNIVTSKYGTVLDLNSYPQEVINKAFYHPTPKIWISKSSSGGYTTPVLIGGRVN